MINSVQIRTARALLDWSTSELANRADMTVNAINRIERGHVNAQRGTIEKLEEIFDAAGIEFLPASGLRLRDKKVVIHEGDGFRRKNIEDITNTLEATGGEVLIAHEDEYRALQEIGEEYLMEQLKKRWSCGVTHRCLVRARDKGLIPPLDTYHVVPDEFFSSYPLSIYGNKLALTSRAYAPRTVIIEDAQFAESIRKLFNYIWDNTLDIPTYRKLAKSKIKSGATEEMAEQ